MHRQRVLVLVAAALLCKVAVRAEEVRVVEQHSDPKADAVAEPTPAVQSAPPTAGRRTQLEEVVVEAKRPMSAASSDEIRARDYELRPHATMQEILNNIPGVVVAQHQGGGKATQYLVRGFDADHGTDFAVFVDDLPVNLPTHAHGQGYADLNFLIPDVVDRLQLYKGPYFVQFGDFANAGALNFVTKDEVEENYGAAYGGSFDTQRYVALASPKLNWAKTLIAAQAYFSNGPFVNPQHYARYNFYSKFTLNPTPDSKLSIAADVYDGDWDGSGQIPLRAVQETFGQFDSATPRNFGRFDSIDPTEGGSSDRENLNLHYTYTPSPEEEWAFQVYGSRYKLKLFTDFTFFKDIGFRFFRQNGDIIDRCSFEDCSAPPTDMSRDYVPADGIEQNDQRVLYGARAKYTRYWSVASVPLQSQIALETRNDDIDVALHRQVKRNRFFTINELNVQERTASGYLQQLIFLRDWIRLEAGLRGDVYFIDGDNRLPGGESTTETCTQFTPGCDPNFAGVPIGGNTIQSVVSPKVTLVITPVADTDIYLNYGNGFHSNDARNALTAKATPQDAHNINSLLATSNGYEAGVRTRQFDRLDAAAALWLLDLQSELVFSGDAGMQETGAGGTFEPSGPTRRWGIDFEMRYQFTNWLFMDYDLSYADPRFKNGDAIALAPTLLMNGGLAVELPYGFSAALRMRFLGDRPAIEDRSLTARGYTLLDLLGKYRWRNVEASIAFLNLTDTDWREAQFADTSCVYGEIDKTTGNSTPQQCSSAPGKQGSHPDPSSDIHFTPGNPFGVRGGLTVYF